MARIRFVKPEFFSDAKLVKIKPVVRLFYIGLFTQADREGRFCWNEEDLKIKIIPYDKTTGAECLAELVRIGRIVRYGKSGEFGVIVNFLKHQYINPREPETKIPAPEKGLIPVLYQTDTGILDKGIRNKDKGERASASLKWLENVPTEDLSGLYLKYRADRKEIQHKAGALLNWLKSKGVVKKNYKAFLEIALEKDFGRRTPEDIRLKVFKTQVIDGKVVEEPNEKAVALAKKWGLKY